MLPLEEINLPPTDHALRMKPWFVASLLVLMVIVIGKFIISDFFGGICMFAIVLMGVLVLTGDHGISATNALFYSMMAMISGIFDVISCMLYFQHSKYKAFEHGAPNLVIAAQLIFICSPIFLLISSTITYSIFSDCQSHAEELMPAMGGGHFNDFGPYGIREPPSSQGPAGQQQQQRDRPFTAFQGQGRRL